MQKAEGPALSERFVFEFSGIGAKTPALFPDVPAAHAGYQCRNGVCWIGLLENLHQNICCGTDLNLDLVDPNTSGGVAYPYRWGALSIGFAP